VTKLYPKKLGYEDTRCYSNDSLYRTLVSDLYCQGRLETLYYIYHLYIYIVFIIIMPTTRSKSKNSSTVPTPLHERPILTLVGYNEEEI
jgi:hypothetical protein